MKWLVRLSENLLATVALLLYGWFVPFVRLVRAVCARLREQKRRRDEGRSSVRCVVIPKTIYKRPDPLIYSQKYLMSKGLAVTWDNPDITLFRNGLPVPSSELVADTDYEVRATVWNGSAEAPAINMAVDFSFLTFGIGTTSTGIGRPHIDLPVKGAAGHPATATMTWHTPAAPGHYCLQVKLVWGDDANPDNNLGQENTIVGVAHSPAVFEFPVQNETERVTSVTLEADTYTLSDPVDCQDVINGRVQIPGRETGTGAPLTQKELCTALASLHRKDAFPVPADWKVEIGPPAFDLMPHQSRSVTVRVTPPDTFVNGTRAFNVNAYDKDHKLIGGVTLYVQR
jgi:hypothetical protein